MDAKAFRWTHVECLNLPHLREPLGRLHTHLLLLVNHAFKNNYLAEM